MNTSLSWIKMYVPDLDCSAQEYCDAMTLSGTKVEGFTRLDRDLEKILSGRYRRKSRPDCHRSSERSGRNADSCCSARRKSSRRA